MKTFTSFLFSTALVLAGTLNLSAQQLENNKLENDTTRVIVIKIENVRSDQGSVLAMAKIPGVAEPVYQMVKAKTGAVVLELKAGQAESVELSIFHDENGNYQLEMGERGPVEGYVTQKCKIKEKEQTFSFLLYYPVPPQKN